MLGVATTTPALRPYTASPVPHWVALLTVVPALWLVIGAVVVLLDRLLGWLGN